ncbi:hypothetical protein NS228_20355 [Methylobacterium indicum]|uniref:DUF433 domain-containing protein n=1 Tax=Methylobacterium indicum TaxID=1775910 RepID=A0A8H8WQV6_9HYPH|nr:DUF433 domain-containing protein [Methylobacterium indicum]KTS25052.1 hypothetical protein NS229_20610 [Methylobacterium indicum]KTS35632.1 hypothetical protein NS228_20355 [Methylobacterium indicum]KTS46002.1 hypothetical protein NS230_22760 [Methylobacterium indicum]BCM82676.1 hypothetical protein mvi_11370 [Methylobacterium indicum]
MSSPEIYPLPKAAFVLREPVREVRRTVERKHVDCQLVSYGGRKVRALDHKTLVFLSWARDHRDDLNAALWGKLYAALQQHAELPTHLEAGVFRASLDEAAQQVDDRLQALRDLETSVEHDAKGDVVLKGTRVEVHRLAALLDGGMAIEDVLRDYPSLSRDQLAFAEAYAAAHPKAGRPYPKLTAKAALAQADLSALDLDD